MKILRKLRNYLCYCGIEKDEYNAIKKGAYVSNFEVWRVIHCLMTFVFGALFVNALGNNMLVVNGWLYLAGFAYSGITTAFFFIMRKDLLVAQFWIYLSISLLFLFGAFITENRPEYPAVTFVVMLIITPMFMIDKPFFMGIVLCIASAVFLVWMHGVKPHDVWMMDLINTSAFAVVGFFLHIISNSIRIREFVLTRKINIQKDTDDLTGLMNKGALTGAINGYISDPANDRGIMFIVDIDRFKSINDTYGHDVGDSVISQLGAFMKGYFTNGEIVGRFGGDEFIVFVKDTDSEEVAAKLARGIREGTAESIKLPDGGREISVSIGAALYHGGEKNYSEIFKKADVALYKTKADRSTGFNIYE